MLFKNIKPRKKTEIDLKNWVIKSQQENSWKEGGGN